MAKGDKISFVAALMYYGLTQMEATEIMRTPGMNINKANDILQDLGNEALL